MDRRVNFAGLMRQGEPIAAGGMALGESTTAWICQRSQNRAAATLGDWPPRCQPDRIALRLPRRPGGGEQVRQPQLLQL